MNRRGALLLTLACASCGGRVDHAAIIDDGGPLVDAGTASTEIPAGDAGLICSIPVVSLDDSTDGCTFSMSCTGGLSVQGRISGPAAVVQCSVNGRQTNTFTKLAAAGQEALDCTDPATLAPLAMPCSP